MRKHLLIAAAAAALLLPVLSSGAYADPPKQEDGAQWKLSDEDRAALVDARVAGLKAGLKLTAAQEKSWPAVEAAIRERAKAHAAECADKSKEHEESHDLIERMQRHAKEMETHAAQLMKFSEAVKPLYDEPRRGPEAPPGRDVARNGLASPSSFRRRRMPRLGRRRRRPGPQGLIASAMNISPAREDRGFPAPGLFCADMIRAPVANPASRRSKAMEPTAPRLSFILESCTPNRNMRYASLLRRTASRRERRHFAAKADQ